MNGCWLVQPQSWMCLVFSLPCRWFRSLTWCVTVSVFATRLPAIFTFVCLKSSLAQCWLQPPTRDTPAWLCPARFLMCPTVSSVGMMHCATACSCQLNVRINGLYWDTGVLLSLVLFRWCRIHFTILPQGWKNSRLHLWRAQVLLTVLKKKVSMSFKGPSIENV